MTTSLGPQLESFAAWIHQTDPHASHRLNLLQRARRLLGTSDPAALDERIALADGLERWRYQRLNQCAGTLAPEDEALLAALDLSANQLSGRPARPPRTTRLAIHDATQDWPAMREALACLDSRIPLEDVAQQAAQRTREHFLAGQTPQRAGGYWPMLLYAPIYLSNHCINHCTYCGFRHPNPIGRRHLQPAEVLREARFLGKRGFRHLLLVAGDFPSLTSTGYFSEILATLAAEGFQLGIEIAPQSTDAYDRLQHAGARAITLYQETYQPQLYAAYHPRGSKSSYDWRLEGAERAAEAGVERLGLGILLGLADPQQDLVALLRHARYLHERFPDRTLAFSLPRIHDAPAGFQIPWKIHDELFVRMYCALRTAFPAAMLVLSTREAPALRNRLARICITQLSAGSSTAPGGYETPDPHAAGEQFPVCDHRSVAEVAQWLQQSGFAIRWSLDGRTD